MSEKEEITHPRIYLGEDEVSDIFPDPCVAFNIHWPNDDPEPLTLYTFEERDEALTYVQTLIGDLQRARGQLKSYFAYHMQNEDDE